jgi:Domain of unknown function (DUF4411)
MSYVFDNSPFSTLFKTFYRSRFPSLWVRFDHLVANGQIVSTREVLREIEDGATESLRDWAAQRQELFTTPTAAEGAFVTRIYAIPHFQQNIEQQKILKGGRNADPFVIAKAAVEHGTVVTMELLRPNAARIPNICRRFNIRCLSLEEFMEREGWQF